MNDQELEQKNITISGVEDVQWGVKITDEKGLKYNVPKTLRGTETETKAFQVLKSMAGYGIGKQVSVKFATTPNGQGGQSRYVRIIASPEENSNVAKLENKTNHAVIGKQSDKSLNKVADWEKISTGKVRHGIALKAIEKDMELNAETDKWIKDWTNYIMTGKLDELGFNPNDIF